MSNRLEMFIVIFPVYYKIQCITLNNILQFVNAIKKLNLVTTLSITLSLYISKLFKIYCWTLIYTVMDQCYHFFMDKKNPPKIKIERFYFFMQKKKPPENKNRVVLKTTQKKYKVGCSITLLIMNAIYSKLE